MIALAVVALTKVSKNWGRFCGGIFAFCVTAMPQMFFYGIQIRPYSLAMFLVTMTFLFAYDTAKKPSKQNFVLLTVFAVLSAYTHYYAVVAVAFIYLLLGLWFLIKKQYKSLLPWFVSGFCVPILLLPWLISVRKILFLAMNQSQFGSVFRLRDWLYYLSFPMRFAYGHIPIVQINTLSVCFSWLTYLCVIGAFVCFWNPFSVHDKHNQSKAIEEKNREFSQKLVFEKCFAFSGFAIVVGVVLFALITSIRQNNFMDRYFFPALGCFWLGFAVSLSYLNHSTNLFKTYTQYKKNRLNNIGRYAKRGFSAFRTSKNSIQNVLILFTAVVVVTVSMHNFLVFQVSQIKLYQSSPSPYGTLQADDVVVTDSYLIAYFDSYFSSAKKIYYKHELPSDATKRGFDTWYPSTEYIADYTIVDTLMQNNSKLVFMFHSGVVPDEIMTAAEQNNFAIKKQASYFVGKRSDADYFADDFTLFTCSKIPADTVGN
jgi:hypothetical protein